MKKTTLKLATAAIAAVMATSVAMPIVGNVESVNAATIKEQSIVLESSLYTSVTAPLNPETSPGANYNGAAISFDVLSSDLKSQDKLDALTAQARLLTGETTRYNPLAAVTFAFWADDLSFGSNAHGLYGGTATSQKASEHLAYYANGRMVMHLQYENTRNFHEVTKLDGEGNLVWNDYGSMSANANYMSMPCGNLEEVKNFLNPGYSYKVEFNRGNAEYDEDTKVLTWTAGRWTNASGTGFNNPWYVAYKKAVNETTWTPIFAIPISRGYENTCNITASSAAAYAGFEVQATSYYGAANGTAAGSYSTNAINTTMEFDNVRIENYGNGTTNRVAQSDFNSVNAADFNWDDESAVLSSGKAGAYTTALSGNYAYYSQNSVTVDGLTITSINAPKEAIASHAKRSVKVIAEYAELSFTANGETETDLVAVNTATTLPTAEKAGYQFIGWKNEAGELYAGGASYTPTDSVAFEAIFVQLTNKVGASIRYGTQSGIRFAGLVDKATIDTLEAMDITYELGMYFTAEGSSVTAGGACPIRIENGDNYQVYGVLYNLQENVYNVTLKSDIYLTVTYSDGSEATFTADDVEGRSYKQVVETLLTHTTATASGSYVNEVTTVAGETAYTYMTVEQYDALKAMYNEINV